MLLYPRDETVAGYSGAEVIPGTESAAGPIKSRAAIGWRKPRCAGK